MSTKYSRYSLRALLFALALLAILGSGALANPAWALDSHGASDVSSPIGVQFKMDHLPVLDEAAALSCTASTVRPAPGTTIEFVLPPGAELVGGGGRWTGDLEPGSPLTLNASVRFSQTGQAAVRCRAQRPVDARNSWGDQAALYLTVGRTQTIKGYVPEPVAVGEWVGDGDVAPPAPGTTPSLSRGRNAPEPPAVSADDDGAQVQPDANAPATGLTVKGRWMYYDRKNIHVSASQFLVEVVRADTADHLYFCYTSTQGNFSCGPFTNPGSAGVRVLIYSRVKRTPFNDVLQVTNQDCGTDWTCTYAVTTGKTVLSNGTHNLGTLEMPKDSDWRGVDAFWIKSDIDRAWKYVWSKAGSKQNPQISSGSTTAFWAPDSTDGTYYNIGDEIHLVGDDAYSHDTAIHEYGHQSMYNVYGDWFPSASCPDPHYIQYSDADTVCAWTEGWADFLPLAVNNDPIYHWSSTDYLDLEGPTWGTAKWDTGDTTEGRVAGSLWDILDTKNDGDDKYSTAFSTIFRVFSALRANTFNDYWFFWRTFGNNQKQAVMSIYQNTIDYRPPAAPLLDSPDNGAISPNPFMVFTWDYMPRTSMYKIEVRQGKQTGPVVFTQETEATTSFAIFGVLGWYYWRVEACNQYGCSPWSYFRSFKIAPVTAPN